MLGDHFCARHGTFTTPLGQTFIFFNSLRLAMSESPSFPPPCLPAHPNNDPLPWSLRCMKTKYLLFIYFALCYPRFFRHLSRSSVASLPSMPRMIMLFLPPFGSSFPIASLLLWETHSREWSGAQASGSFSDREPLHMVATGRISGNVIYHLV